MRELSGYTIGITAERRREEFGTALERRGATVRYGTAIRVVPLADDTELRTAIDHCLSAPLDVVVATTGVGFRGWMQAAQDWGLGEAMTASIADSTLLARGPKVRGAIRAHGLREAWSPESESSEEVLEHLLASHDLAGRRVAVQLHGDPLTWFLDAVAAAGAEVVRVPVYRWVPPADKEPLADLVRAVADAGIDAVTFTSAPAAASFLATAEDLGLIERVRQSLTDGVVAACVGPVTAAPLVDAGIPVIQPERARLGALVTEIAEQLPRRRPAAVAHHA